MAPDHVDWHFANIHNRWAKRGLVAAGFGLRRTGEEIDGQGQAIFSIAELIGGEGAVSADSSLKEKRSGQDDVENVVQPSEKKEVVVQGLNRPLLHIDLQEAVEAAIADARTKTW